MLETNGQKTLALGGTNQQDFKAIQLVAGAYPYQKGLQQRFPGKTLQRITTGPVGSIYVFYMVFGRAYTLTDFGSLQIDEVVIPPITLPGLPPTDNVWFDTFGGYTLGSISRLWGGGVWPIGVGVCETLIVGIIDPFLVYATIAPGRENPPDPLRPKPVPPPAVSPALPPVTPPPFGGTPPADRAFTSYAPTLALSGLIHHVADDHPRVFYPPESNAAWLARGLQPGFADPVYDDPQTGADLSADLTQGGFVGYGNIAFGAFGYDYRDTTGWTGEGVMNLTSLGSTARRRIFLVGTKTTSDGVTNSSTVVVTVYDDITAYANVTNHRYYVFPPDGIRYYNPSDPSVGGQTNNKIGRLVWNEIRVYDPDPL